MKQIIHFFIEQEEDGYFANALDGAIVTQGSTFDELIKNIHEAAELYLVDARETSLSKTPTILVNMEVPLHA